MWNLVPFKLGGNYDKHCPDTLTLEQRSWVWSPFVQYWSRFKQLIRIRLSYWFTLSHWGVAGLWTIRPFFKNFWVPVSGQHRCLSDSVVAKFKEAIPSAFNSVPCFSIIEDILANFSPLSNWSSCRCCRLIANYSPFYWPPKKEDNKTKRINSRV